MEQVCDSIIVISNTIIGIFRGKVNPKTTEESLFVNFVELYG